MSPQHSHPEAWFGVCPFDFGNGMLRAQTCQHCQRTAIVCDECEFTSRVNERTMQALLGRDLATCKSLEDLRAYFDAWVASADSALQGEPVAHWPDCPYCGGDLTGAPPASTSEIEAAGLTPYLKGHGG